MKLHAMLAASLFALGAAPLAAEPLRPMFGGALAPAEVNSIVRSMGLLPTSRPAREGMTYSVLASDPRGRQLRVVIDARFGDVLSVRRAMAAGSPGAFPPPPPRVYGGFPGRPGPYEMPWMVPDFRPPAMIGRSDPPVPRPPAADKTQQKSAGSPASTNSAVVTVGPAAASRADPRTTGSTKAPSFPPAQSLE